LKHNRGGTVFLFNKDYINRNKLRIKRINKKYAKWKKIFKYFTTLIITLFRLRHIFSQIPVFVRL